MSDPLEPKKEVLAFHLNAFGMILHMEHLAGLNHLRPISYCFGKTLAELWPGNIGLRILGPISDALIEGPSGKAHIFNYQLRLDKRYQASITYLRPDTVLAVIHEL